MLRPKQVSILPKPSRSKDLKLMVKPKARELDVGYESGRTVTLSMRSILLGLTISVASGLFLGSTAPSEGAAINPVTYMRQLRDIQASP